MYQLMTAIHTVTREKKRKSKQFGKEEIKMSLFTHEIITCVKSPKEIVNALFRNIKCKE